MPTKPLIEAPFLHSHQPNFFVNKDRGNLAGEMSNMSRNVAPVWIAPLIIVFTITGLASFGARAQAPQNWIQSGMLRCRLNPSIGFVIFGHQSMECQFMPSHQGAPQR